MKIGKTLGIGTGLVQRVLVEQPRLFDVDVAEARVPVGETETAGAEVSGGLRLKETKCRSSRAAQRSLWFVKLDPAVPTGRKEERNGPRDVWIDFRLQRLNFIFKQPPQQHGYDDDVEEEACRRRQVFRGEGR